MATTEIERAQYVLYEIVYYIVCDNISLDLSVTVGKRTISQIDLISYVNKIVLYE